MIIKEINSRVQTFIKSLTANRRLWTRARGVDFRPSRKQREEAAEKYINELNVSRRAGRWTGLAQR